MGSPTLTANDGSKAGKVEPPPSHRNGVRLRSRLAYFLLCSPELCGLVDKFFHTSIVFDISIKGLAKLGKVGYTHSRANWHNEINPQKCH